MFANGCYQRICFIDPSRSILHFRLEAAVSCADHEGPVWAENTLSGLPVGLQFR